METHVKQYPNKSWLKAKTSSNYKSYQNGMLQDAEDTKN